MADNFKITEGTGPKVATDEIGGRHFQIVKLDVGAPNASQGVNATTPLPINRASSTASYGQVGTSPTAVQIRGSNSNRKHLTLTNIGSETVFIGSNNNVTTSTGYPIPENGVFEDIAYTGFVWAISVGSSGQLGYWEVG